MSDITISYKGSNIATMDATGTKTLLTEGKYCEDDISIAYVKPSGGGGSAIIEDTTDAAGGIIRTITAQGAVIPSASGAFSKIILNGITQIDLTQDTVAAANLLTGETAHGADGQPVVGAASGGGTDYLQERLENTLTSYSNSNLERIESYGFCGCSNLRTLTLPALESIGNFGLRNSGIENMNFPSLLTTGDQSTRDLPNLTSVNLPNLTRLGSQGFSNCPYLTSVYMPKVSGILGSPFEGCIRLPAVDFASGVSRLGGNGVRGCTVLKTIILRSTSVVTLQYAISFDNTPFASGGSGGTIYVPSDLIASYKAATNWSSIDGYGTVTWAAIEGSQYENYYADGTPISA